MFRTLLAPWRQAPPGASAEAGDPPVPPWATALVELVQKVTRSQARGQVQSEGLERKVEAGFADLRQQVGELARAGAGGRDLDWDPLLDALDGLAEAETVARELSAPLVAGLRGIAERLATFASEAGLTRIDTAGAQPDGRFYRVVGTTERADVEAGAIVRVVRAAVLRGERLIREGECVIAVAPASAAPAADSPESIPVASSPEPVPVVLEA